MYFISFYPYCILSNLFAKCKLFSLPLYTNDTDLWLCKQEQIEIGKFYDFYDRLYEKEKAEFKDELKGAFTLRD